MPRRRAAAETTSGGRLPRRSPRRRGNFGGERRAGGYRRAQRKANVRRSSPHSLGPLPFLLGADVPQSAEQLPQLTRRRLIDRPDFSNPPKEGFSVECRRPMGARSIVRPVHAREAPCAYGELTRSAV